jgi:hypothetical protein
MEQSKSDKTATNFLIGYLSQGLKPNADIAAFAAPFDYAQGRLSSRALTQCDKTKGNRRSFDSGRRGDLRSG